MNRRERIKIVIANYEFPSQSVMVRQHGRYLRGWVTGYLSEVIGSLPGHGWFTRCPRRPRCSQGHRSRSKKLDESFSQAQHFRHGAAFFGVVTAGSRCRRKALSTLAGVCVGAVDELEEGTRTLLMGVGVFSAPPTGEFFQEYFIVWFQSLLLRFTSGYFHGMFRFFI